MGYRKFFIMIALLFIGQPVFAQRGLQISGGVIGNPQVIYVADVLTLSGQLPAGRGVGKDLLYIELTNPTGLNAILNIRFSKDGRQIAEGAWQSRTVQSSVRLTNTNLSQSPYNKVITAFKIDENDFKALAGNTSGSGDVSAPTTLPNGLYVFECWLSSVSGNVSESNHIFITFNITNPSGFVSLIGPGNEPTMQLEEVFTSTPVFQWQGDGQRYRIKVWEKLDGQRTFTEVTGNNPHVDQEVFSPTFQYPVGGVRVLEPGKIYYWQVTSLTGVAGRDNPTGAQSTPFVFKMAEKLKDTKNPPYDVQLQRTKDILKDLGIDAPWLKDADFVSFTVEVKDGTGASNSTDINTLVDELKNLKSGQ